MGAKARAWLNRSVLVLSVVAGGAVVIALPIALWSKVVVLLVAAAVGTAIAFRQIPAFDPQGRVHWRLPRQSERTCAITFDDGPSAETPQGVEILRRYGVKATFFVLSSNAKRHPEALYLILGETHPVVRRREGETYRESLQDMVREFGLQYNVQLIDKYLDFDELVAYLQATDIYLTPYLNPVQIVSGTLAYAVGCGKAIVSTPYLYAEELLAYNRGFLCKFRDVASIAENLNSLLDDPSLRRATERRAYRFGRQMTWPRVAIEYGRLFAELSPSDGAELVGSA